MHTLQVVQPRASAETVEALEFLLQEARGGRLVGIAWIGFHPGRSITADAAGMPRSDPLLARGGAAFLDDALSKLL